MKQLYKILMLFMFVYATFALGKEVYMTSQASLTDLTDDTTTDVPLIEGAAPITVKQDAADVSVETPEGTVNDQQEQLQGSQVSGHFLMGTDDAAAVYWGVYDSNALTLQGEVTWYEDPSLRRVGTGTYVPTGPDSGSISINFHDPNNQHDPGLLWTGTYDKGRWAITTTQTNPMGALTGRVFQAPQ